MEEVLEKLVNAITVRADEHHCQIQTHFDKKTPAIWADADILYQAFLNITLNSIQAMPEGGTLYVDVTSTKKELKITFRDEGTGIPEAILDKIWDPFFTNKEKGTGLGLGIVRKIILVHGGQITITNCPEAGTCVTILLPVLKEPHGKHSHS